MTVKIIFFYFVKDGRCLHSSLDHEHSTCVALELHPCDPMEALQRFSFTLDGKITHLSTKKTIGWDKSNTLALCNRGERFEKVFSSELHHGSRRKLEGDSLWNIQDPDPDATEAEVIYITYQ